MKTIQVIQHQHEFLTDFYLNNLDNLKEIIEQNTPNIDINEINKSFEVLERLIGHSLNNLQREAKKHLKN